MRPANCCPACLRNSRSWLKRHGFHGHEIQGENHCSGRGHSGCRPRSVAPRADSRLGASGLALAVALDAALGGWTPDPGFMAIGTFEADGDVQPVASAIPRLLAVMSAGAKRAVMTEKQVAQITDLMISSGAKLFSTT